MSRSGYGDGCPDSKEEHWMLIRWRGAVKSSIRGKRGQAFLREMAQALDAMPEKRLEAGILVAADGACCAMGTVVIARGLDTSNVDPEVPEEVAGLLGIAPALAAEIAFENDEHWAGASDSEERWHYMRRWVERNLISETEGGA